MSFFLKQLNHWERGCVIFGSTRDPRHPRDCLFFELLFKPFHICHLRGSYMEVYPCFCHEIPYSHVCHQITTRRYGSSDRRWLRCPSAFSDGSLCFVPFSLYFFGFISRIRRNLFIHIARIPIGDSPRVHPNILKCSLYSPVAKGIRLVVFATRAMVCETPTHYLILNPLAFARGCVILRSHVLILLLLFILIYQHIHS